MGLYGRTRLVAVQFTPLMLGFGFCPRFIHLLEFATRNQKSQRYYLMPSAVSRRRPPPLYPPSLPGSCYYLLFWISSIFWFTFSLVRRSFTTHLRCGFHRLDAPSRCFRKLRRFFKRSESVYLRQPVYSVHLCE